MPPEVADYGKFGDLVSPSPAPKPNDFGKFADLAAADSAQAVSTTTTEDFGKFADLAAADQTAPASTAAANDDPVASTDYGKFADLVPPSPSETALSETPPSIEAPNLTRLRQGKIEYASQMTPPAWELLYNLGIPAPDPLAYKEGDKGPPNVTALRQGRVEQRPLDPLVIDTANAIANTPTNVLNFALSPAGLLTAEVVPNLKPVLQRLIAAGFTFDSIRNAFLAPTTKGKIEAGLGAMLTAVGVVKPASEIIKPKGKTDGTIQIGKSEGEVPQTSEAGQNVPSDLGQVGVGDTRGQTAGAVAPEVVAAAEETPTVAQPIGVTETLAELNRRNGRAAELPTPENKGLGLPIPSEQSARDMAKRMVEESEPTPNELAQMEKESQAEAMAAYHEQQGQSSDEILELVAKHGGLQSPGHPERVARIKSAKTKGATLTKDELDTVYSEAKVAVEEGRLTRKEFRKLFRPSKTKPLMLVREAAEEAGFPFETEGDMLGALRERFASGRKQYGTMRLGAVAPGTGRTMLLIERGRQMVRDIADTIGGKVLPRLTRSGVMDEAVQHASARQYVPALVEDLLAKVFPSKYKDFAAMQRTVDVIKADNILGGYDDALRHLDELQTAEHPNEAAIAEQEKFIEEIQNSQDLDALSQKVLAAKGTDIEADIHRWEKIVTPLMDSLYNELKGVEPETPRETRGRHFGARMNLLPNERAQRLAAFADPNQPLPEIAVSNYRNPNLKRDKFMRQALLTGDYSSDPNLVLLNSFAGRWNEVTKLRFYKALEAKGVAEIAEPGMSAPTELNGKPVARMPIKMPETNPATGKTQMVERSLFVQKDLVNEVRNTLNTDGRLTQNRLFQALTQLQLFQLADATAHTKNIHSVVVNMLGNSSMGRDLLRKVPGLGTTTAVTEIARVSRQIASDSPAIRAEIAEMTRRGMIRPEYPMTGVQKITRMQQLIHDVDTASRVIMNRRFTNLVERGLAKDTIENRRNFVQQIGEYNRRLMSRQEAYLRDYGISPFIVAGRTFNRFSRRLVAGSPGFETRSGRAEIVSRSAQITGLAFAVTLPATINIFTTGSMGGREGTPVGAIDFGPDYDTADGKHRVLDVFQLIGLRRGLRGTGVEAAIEGVRKGEDWNTIAGNAAEGALSTSLHPYIGPGVGGVYQTLTGKRIDLRTGWQVDVPQSRKYPGASQLAENFRVALKTQNPFLYGIVQNGLETGMDKVFGIPPDDNAPSSGAQIGAGLLKAPLSALGYKEIRPPDYKAPKRKTKKSEASKIPVAY